MSNVHKIFLLLEQVFRSMYNIWHHPFKSKHRLHRQTFFREPPRKRWTSSLKMILFPKLLTASNFSIAQLANSRLIELNLIRRNYKFLCEIYQAVRCESHNCYERREIDRFGFLPSYHVHQQYFQKSQLNVDKYMLHYKSSQSLRISAQFDELYAQKADFGREKKLQKNLNLCNMIYIVCTHCYSTLWRFVYIFRWNLSKTHERSIKPFCTSCRMWHSIWIIILKRTVAWRWFMFMFEVNSAVDLVGLDEDRCRVAF